MARPHEEITTGNIIGAMIPGSLIIALFFYFIGWQIHFLFYAALWVFLGWLSLTGIISGKRKAAAEEAQIEINERQQSDTPVGSESGTPGVEKINKTKAGPDQGKKRGDFPDAPPPSNNWPK